MIERIQTDDAPSFEAFDLPISQGTVHGDTLYLAGQTGVDPATGELVDDCIEAQTTQTLENIEALLQAGGTGWENVLDVTVYLSDMEDFATVNEIYARYVTEPFPARSAVEVSDLARNFDVEIEVIAAR